MQIASLTIFRLIIDPIQARCWQHSLIWWLIPRCHTTQRQQTTKLGLIRNFFQLSPCSTPKYFLFGDHEWPWQSVAVPHQIPCLIGQTHLNPQSSTNEINCVNRNNTRSCQESFVKRVTPCLTLLTFQREINNCYVMLLLCRTHYRSKRILVWTSVPPSRGTMCRSLYWIVVYMMQWRELCFSGYFGQVEHMFIGWPCRLGVTSQTLYIIMISKAQQPHSWNTGDIN